MAASDNTLYLYTSLTAGSSHIITATSRLETILKANKIPFRAIDVATDDAARRLWGRYSKGRKLPGLVKYRTIVGDLEQIEEWNEYGELKMQIGAVTDPDDFSTSTAGDTAPIKTSAPSEAPKITSLPMPITPSKSASGTSSPHVQIQNPPVKEAKEDQRSLTLRLAGEEAAARAKQNALSKLGTKPPTTEGDGKATPSSDPKIKGTETVEVEEEESKKPQQQDSGEVVAGEAASPREKSTPTASPSGRRRSVVPEIVPPMKRPSLADETAAVSSANFHVENAELLGLIDHHRGSIISATTKDEQEQVKSDIRASITEAPADSDIQALRDAAAKKEGEIIFEDEVEEAAAENSDKNEKEAVAAAGAAKEKIETSAEAAVHSDDKDIPPQSQDPKDDSKAGVSVSD